MYSVWPLKKLSLTPKYSIDITGMSTIHNARQCSQKQRHMIRTRGSESKRQRMNTSELTNFHHRISFHNRSLVFGNIKRCGIIRISSLAMWVLVHVKMCATYNRPLYVSRFESLFSPALSMKFMDNGLAALSTVFLCHWEKPYENLYTHTLHTLCECLR